MKRLLLILLLFSTPAWATWALVQQANSSTNCSSSTTTNCGINVTATGAGHLLVFMAFGASTTLTTPTTTGGTCGGAGWATGIRQGGSGIQTAVFWCLSSTSGITNVTSTLTTSGAGRTAWFYEFSYTASSITLDGTSTGGTFTSTATPLGVALTLTGTNDVVVQSQYQTSATNSTITSTGTCNGNWVRTSGVNVATLSTAYCINKVDGTAPTWTIQTAQSGVVTGTAWQEVTAAATATQIGAFLVQ